MFLYYFFIFVWVLFMYLVSKGMNVYQRVQDDNRIVYRWRFFPAFIAFLPVIILAGFTTPRYDTVAYLIGYNSLNTTVNGLRYSLAATDEKGWVLFQWLIKSVFHGNETTFRAVLVAIHSIPVLYFFRKYSYNYLYSLYLFLACSCHFAWMMNGMRQFLAVSIILLSVPYLLRKKYIPTIFIILIASTFHTSALVMIPIVFIAHGKPWNKRTVLFIVAASIGAYLFSRDTDLMDSMLVNTSYAGAIGYSRSIGDDGVNPVRVLIYMVPPILALVKRRQIEAANELIINISVNMSVVTACLYLVAMVTSGIMVGRLPIYTSLFDFILLPYIIKRTFKPSISRIINMFAIGLFFVFYLFESGVL